MSRHVGPGLVRKREGREIVQLPASAAGGSKASGWAELAIAKTAAEEAALRRNPLRPLRPQPGNFTE